MQRFQHLIPTFDHMASLDRVTRLTFFRPNFRNLATFEIGLPEKNSFGLFWPHLKLVGLKKSVWHFFGLIMLKKIPLKENITFPFFTRMQNLCNKCSLDTRSDVGNISQGCDVQNKFFARSLKMCALCSVLHCVVCCK